MIMTPVGYQVGSFAHVVPWPFLLYEVVLGDVVEAVVDLSVTRVVKASGRLVSVSGSVTRSKRVTRSVRRCLRWGP